MWNVDRRVVVLTWHSDANFFDGRVVFFVQLKVAFDIMTLDLFGIELVERDFFLVHGGCEDMEVEEGGGWGNKDGYSQGEKREKRKKTRRPVRFL